MRNVNRVPCNVVIELRYVIMEPWNVNRGPWNVNRVPRNVIMGLWNVNKGSWCDYGTVECE